MDPKDEEERRRSDAENARKMLADGTWPQVMGVFGYRNPRAPRVADGEFARLKALYEAASCPNMAAFVELVQFEEKRRDVTMSFNFSMRYRRSPGDASPVNAESAALLFSCPDILLGTRNGIEGATVWFKNFLEAIPKMAPESVQVTDKIFGEAIEYFKGVSRSMSVAEMLEGSILGKGDFLPPSVPSKH